MNRISAFILKTPRTLLFSSCLVKTHYQAISVQSERDSITRMLISHFQLSQLWEDFFSFIGHPASNAVIVPELRVLIKINKSASGRHTGEGLGGIQPMEKQNRLLSKCHMLWIPDYQVDEEGLRVCEWQTEKKNKSQDPHRCSLARKKKSLQGLAA